MSRDLLTLSLGVGVILLTAQALHSQESNCAKRDRMIAMLSEKYGETRRSAGLAGDTQIVELFASDTTGSWTITVTTPSGIACMVAAGSDFRVVQDPAPIVGDPA